MTHLTQSRLRLIGASILAGAILATAGPVLAQSANDAGSPNVRVSYSDLDLASRTGAREMLSRIRYAARQVCGGDSDIRVLAQHAQFVSCEKSAVAGAVGELAARSGAGFVVAGK